MEGKQRREKVRRKGEKLKQRGKEKKGGQEIDMKRVEKEAKVELGKRKGREISPK